MNSINIASFGFDHGTFGMKGLSSAPKILRQIMKVSKDTILRDKSTNNVLVDYKVINDLGHFEYSPDIHIDNFMAGISRISECSKNEFSLTLLGDHLGAYSVIKGALKRNKNIQILHIDAHFDMNEKRENQSLTHNNFVSELLKEEGIKKWICLGQRGNSSFEKELNPKVQTACLESVLKALDPNLPVHITFDVDAISADSFMAVNYPEWGSEEGFEFKDILDVIKLLKRKNIEILGMDISEYNPSLDFQNYFYGRKLSDFIIKLLAQMQGNQNE